MTTLTASLVSLARTLSASVLVLAALSLLDANAAHADDDVIISNPGQHQHYNVELEPHLLVGLNGIYASEGIGIGGRASIPIVQNGFIPNLNNSVAISFGADLLHYGGCYFTGGSCSANYLYFPVTAQWNFYFTKKWNAFGEAGLFLYKGFFDACVSGVPCGHLQEVGVLPIVGVGGRYQVTDSFALTARIGFPTITLGVSFFQ